MDYGDIVLSGSLALDVSISETSSALQRLYERGDMSYPRSRDHAITPEAFKRVMAMAKINGAAFNPRLFKQVRNLDGEYAHESPNPLIVDVPLNRDFALLGFDERVLVHIARQLVSCAVPAMVEQPRIIDLAELPSDVAMLNWRRVVPVGGVLWEPKVVEPGFKPWTTEQSLLHFMQKNELGRPSTWINHVEKFLARSLVDENFELTQKGRDWSYTVGEIFGHKNISKMVEHYLDDNKKPAPEMVADIIEMCGLTEKIGSAVIQESDNEYQTFEI
jgi:DNA topoisomerase-1